MNDTNTATVEETSHSEQQAKAQLDSIIDMLASYDAIEGMDGSKVYFDGDQCDRDQMLERIENNALSVEVRSGWCAPYNPQDRDQCPEPGEFRICLCTGGPAVQIVGDFGSYNAPENVRIQHQDWGTPWTDYPLDEDQQAALDRYCGFFYFGD